MTQFKPSSRNKLANCHNRFQGPEKRVLCVCSAGLLRSPTMARVLAEEYNYNTRAVGLESEYALIDITDVLIEWADEVIVAERWMGLELMNRFPELTEFVCLDVPDQYNRMNPELVEAIKKAYAEHLEDVKPPKVED